MDKFESASVLDSNLFISKRHYYLILFSDKIFKLLWWISRFLGVWKTRHGKKNRIIFIGPTHLGDVMLMTPAIRFAKERDSNLEIICIVSSSSKAAIENNPNIARIEVLDLPWFEEKGGGFIKNIRSFFQFTKVLKGINAETAFNFSSSSYHREHLAMWLAGIPYRIGFFHKGFGFLLTGGPSYLTNELIASQKLRMVSDWLGENTENYSLKPDYFVSQVSERRADGLMLSMDFQSDKPVIGINPCAQHNYLWPPSQYIELCWMIYKKWQPNILFLGTKPFEDMIEDIRSQISFKTFSLAGETTLDEFAAILKKVDLLITVDTGARHIANAVSTKVVVLRNGANSIYEFGQYVESENIVVHEVLCSPCGLIQCKYPRMYCMEDISAEQCFQAVRVCMRDAVLTNPLMV